MSLTYLVGFTVASKLSASILAASLFTVTFAVNLQAPLYSTYVAESAFGATAVTIAFAAYVAGLMPALVLLGGSSDRLGRRIPLAAALLLSVLATALLVVSHTWIALVVARFLLGVGTGLATTAGTAYMTEIMGEKQARSSALIVTSSTSVGFGGGALATGISLAFQGETFLPASYVMLFCIAPLLAPVVLQLPRVDAPRGVSVLRLPVFPSGASIYGIAMALAWSATGMIIAVVPLQLESTGIADWTGLVVFLAIFTGFLCQPIAKRMTNAQSLAVGFILIPLGFLVLLIGASIGSIGLVLLGTCMTSASSYGFTYLAALSEFSLRAPDDRARATAGLFIYAYIGFSLPVIASGAIADVFGLLQAMTVFLVAQTLVTAMAFLRVAITARRRRVSSLQLNST